MPNERRKKSTSSQGRLEKWKNRIIPAQETLRTPPVSEGDRSQYGLKTRSTQEMVSMPLARAPPPTPRKKPPVNIRPKVVAQPAKPTKESSSSSSMSSNQSKQKILKNSRARLKKTSPRKTNSVQAVAEPSSQSAEVASQLDDLTTATSGPRDSIAARFRDFARHCQSMKLKDYITEFDSLPLPHPDMCIAFFGNLTQNRYHNIMCLDESRVVLRSTKEPNRNQYIHANKVTYPSLKKPFIITQGPLSRTIPDFWRMIWQERVEAIIMLCRVVEGGKKKCAEYFSSHFNEAQTYGQLRVTLKGQATDLGVVTSEIELVHKGTTRRLKHYQWKNWPDCQAVNDSRTMSVLLNTVRECESPVVVHCSAGIGRSGTLVALEMCIMDIIGDRPISVNQVVKDLRKFRCQAIQTADQYLSLYKFVLQFGEQSGYIKQDDAENFYRILDEYAQTLDD